MTRRGFHQNGDRMARLLNIFNEAIEQKWTTAQVTQQLFVGKRAIFTAEEMATLIGAIVGRNSRAAAAEVPANDAGGN